MCAKPVPFQLQITFEMSPLGSNKVIFNQKNTGPSEQVLKYILDSTEAQLKEKVVKVSKHRTLMEWCTVWIACLLSNSSIVSTYILFQSGSHKVVRFKT